jgi:hypothetical protein
MAHEFSQTEGAKDTQQYQEATSCHNRVPGMFQYVVSNVDMNAGTAVAHPCDLSFSTRAAKSTELPHFSDGFQESSNHDRHFSSSIR